MFDSEELRDWIERWYRAEENEEELQSLVRIFHATGIPFDEFKIRLMNLGMWKSEMETLLKPDYKKKID